MNTRLLLRLLFCGVLIGTQALGFSQAPCKQLTSTPHSFVVAGSSARKRHELFYRERVTPQQARKTAKMAIAIPEVFASNSGYVATTPASSFWLTRIVFTRWLTFVYAFAFLASIKQNRQLLGNKGILPARNYLEFRATGSCKGTQPKKISKSLFAGLPTLFWFVNWDFMDLYLDLVAGAGLLLSTATFMLGTSNMLVMALLWSLYLSIVNIGQTWFAYGWESQLLETGFLAIFLYPALKLAALNSSTPVPWVCIWGFRWLLFRVMLGSGLIKLRGDPCWRDLTAMHYHYETQPIPNPLSYWLHKLPGWYHRFETFMNHVMEVAVPWLLLAPIRALFLPAGLLQIVFQFVLISSGNLAFVNWLTIAPALFCLDDQFWRSLLFKAQDWQDALAGPAAAPPAVLRPGAALPSPSAAASALTALATPGAVLRAGLFLLLARRSVPVVRNLCSPRQVMNRSYGPLRLVNTYGFFGSVTRQRREMVLQGAAEWRGEATAWREYELPAKPGAVGRRPPVAGPYHRRLDWQLWIAALGPLYRSPWVVALAKRLLSPGHDRPRGAGALFAVNPFAGGPPPECLRAVRYRYRFSGALRGRGGGGGGGGGGGLVGEGGAGLVHARGDARDCGRPYSVPLTRRLAGPRFGKPVIMLLFDSVSSRCNKFDLLMGLKSGCELGME